MHLPWIYRRVDGYMYLTLLKLEYGKDGRANTRSPSVSHLLHMSRTIGMCNIMLKVLMLGL